ncbi:DinB family protein [Kribbella sp. NBC_00482]
MKCAGLSETPWTEETARHVGHLDIIRELIDGATGYTELG